MRRAILYLSITCLFAAVWVSASSEAASLNAPGANTNIANPVPLAVVEGVALYKAKELWGQVSPGEPIPLVDQDGKLTCYMVPFKIGTESFPPYDEIMKEVQQGRKLVSEARQGFFEKAHGAEGSGPVVGASRPNAAGAGSSELQGSPRNPAAHIPPASEAGSPTPEQLDARLNLNPMAHDFQKAIKAAKAKEIGVGRYGTVYVAASYDKFPIPLIEDFLSPFYVSGDLAKQKADKTFGKPATLSKIYFFGLLGTFFEFGSGAQKLTVHAYSLEAKGIPKYERKGPPDPEANKMKMKAEWIKLKEAAGMKEGGKS